MSTWFRTSGRSCFVGGLASLLLIFRFEGSAAAEPPNVILLLADDFGYECVGANGGTSYATPHLDRLAKTGARFEHCYAQPLCTPTRVQLMTGQSNVRNYVRFGLLDPTQITFAQLLKNAGYSTGIFGKWQLENGLDGPKHFGFDEHCLWQLNRRPPRYANPGLEINGQQVDFSDGQYGPDIVQKYAIDFVERYREKPFFLYYPMMLTHGPYQPTPDSPDWDAKAVGEDVSQHDRHFGEMVCYLDRLVGQLVLRLDELHLRERTLILFVGDNGTASKLESKWNGQTVVGGKAKTTDNGTRVPLIVNWPGRVKSAVIRDLVDTTDFLPTICEATGAAVPASVPLDGRSFLPQSLEQTGNPRDWIYAWYAPNQGRRQDEPVEFARTEQYKLFRDGRFFQLDGRYGERMLKNEDLDPTSGEAKALLQRALDRYTQARPINLRNSTKP